MAEQLNHVDDSHHLMRFVSLKGQIRHPETNEFLGIISSAFHIQPKDQGGLSVTWVEHYGQKCTQTYKVACDAYRGSMDSQKIPKSGYFSIGNAGATKAHCAARGKKIRLVHCPDRTNTGHVEIHRFSDEDKELLETLASDVYTEHVSVQSLL